MMIFAVKLMETLSVVHILSTGGFGKWIISIILATKSMCLQVDNWCLHSFALCNYMCGSLLCFLLYPQKVCSYYTS